MTVHNMVPSDIVSLMAEAQEWIGALRRAMATVLIGQDELVDGLLIGLLTNGHLLVEGVPGLAKTLAVKTFAAVLGMSCNRIQFTSDLLPADVLGTTIYHPRDGSFSLKEGPIFGNLVLADEINRAPAKVQSALLEAMQERQVTIGNQTLPLPDPFLVIATQNPIEHQGTYPLPEAQLDRFMLKINITYPSREEETRIMSAMGNTRMVALPPPAVDCRHLPRWRNLVDQLYLDEKVCEYIVDLIGATRDPAAVNLPLNRFIQFGASPRATIYLAIAARARALINNRPYVLPDDVKAVAPAVLRHRIIVTFEADAEELTADHLLQRLLTHLPVH